jgi:heme exporter protein CcmD
MSDDLHIGFIVAAYAVAAFVIGAMIAAIVLDGRRLRRALARFGADAQSRE